MRFRRLLAMGGCALALAACDEKDDSDDSEEAADTCEASVTYAAVAKPIVAKYCLGCHSSSVSGDAREMAPKDANFDNEAELFEHGGHIHERVTDSTMPPDNASVGKLTAAERESFLEWLECSGAAAQHHHDDE